MTGANDVRDVSAYTECIANTHTYIHTYTQVYNILYGSNLRMEGFSLTMNTEELPLGCW
jgi:hypothetical protein